MITFNKTKTTLAAIACTLSLSACVGGGTSQAIVANSAFGGALAAAQTPVSETDLARSCSDINAELRNIYARVEQVNAEEEKRQRRAGLTNGLLNTGITILGGSAIAGAGSAGAIRNAGVATDVARGAANASSATGPDLQTVNSQSALAGRAAQLERTKAQKGCQ